MKLKIESKGSGSNSYIYLNDERLKYVKSCNLEIKANEIVTVWVELMPEHLEIEIDGLKYVGNPIKLEGGYENETN